MGMVAKGGQVDATVLISLVVNAVCKHVERSQCVESNGERLLEQRLRDKFVAKAVFHCAPVVPSHPGQANRTVCTNVNKYS